MREFDRTNKILKEFTSGKPFNFYLAIHESIEKHLRTRVLSNFEDPKPASCS